MASIYNLFLSGLRVLNEIGTAGIAIVAFSLLLYALSFNLRDRVARSFALILGCVVIVFVAEALSSVSAAPEQVQFWLQAQWVGIVYLPATYLHLSDALLATTGRPSRGRRRRGVIFAYLLSTLFLLALPSGLLVGPLIHTASSVPHLQRTTLTLVFTFLYIVAMALTWYNFRRAYNRTVTSTGQRRMRYLIAGGLAPALGSYPYLLFGSGVASAYPLVFWLAVNLSNILTLALLVVMAYAVAFFGVPWPDRVVKRRLVKWILRGPFTAMGVLTFTTLVRRAGETFGAHYTALVPVIMVGSLLLFEHLITLLAPIWERVLFQDKDQNDVTLLESLEDRLLTRGDLYQFLESIVAAVADRLQVSRAFIAAFNPQGLDMLVTLGGENPLREEDLASVDLLELATTDNSAQEMFVWGEYWLIPVFQGEEITNELPGLLGVERPRGDVLDEEQAEALVFLTERASMALQDRYRQQQVFSSLEALTPQMDMIQSLRAAARYDRSEVMRTPPISAPELEEKKLSQWVKEALTHYWGGPKLTQSPLLELQVVEQALKEHEENPTNALRAVLRRAIEQVRPEGERRFTAEWVLYNILEMKFLEGRKVREIALRLAMSEADLYRKQRVAIEAVASAILEMEQQAMQNHSSAVDADIPSTVQQS